MLSVLTEPGRITLCWWNQSAWGEFEYRQWEKYQREYGSLHTANGKHYGFRRAEPIGGSYPTSTISYQPELIKEWRSIRNFGTKGGLAKMARNYYLLIIYGRCLEWFEKIQSDWHNDGTISLQDVTVYTNKEKSFFGAIQANRMNEALNTIMS